MTAVESSGGAAFSLQRWGEGEEGRVVFFGCGEGEQGEQTSPCHGASVVIRTYKMHDYNCTYVNTVQVL